MNHLDIYTLLGAQMAYHLSPLVAYTLLVPIPP